LIGPYLILFARFIRLNTCRYIRKGAIKVNSILINLKRTFFTVLITIPILLAATAAQAQPYQTISTQNSIVGDNLSRTETVIQSGANQLDRFRMIEVTRAGLPNEALQGVVLLVPPLASGFHNYEASDNGDYNNSFVAFFARRNFAVVGFSPRQHGLTAGSCESGAIDCSPMANWGLATVLSDVTYIRQQIPAKYPGLKIVIGGLSMGSVTAMAALNAHPNDYAGAILIDGTIHDPDATVRAINAGFCTNIDGLLAAGIYFDGQSGPGAKALSQVAQAAPNAPVVFPGFPPGITNHQAFVLALSAPPVSPLTPRPGFYNVAGDFTQDRFFYANEALLHANIATFYDYTPFRTIRDLNCGLAGDTTFTNNLGSFNGPVIMFAGGHGFGSAMFSTAQLMTSASVTINFKPDYGHVDQMFAENHLHELEHPIMSWLLQKPFKQ
jgi:pimeloyl-ACP methyl ester carboxylesterase